MKRKLPWLLVTLVFLSAVIVMLWPRQPEVRPQVELSFLYFTNTGMSPEAVFAVHFPPDHGGNNWRQMTMDRWEGGGWKPWKPDGGSLPAIEFQGSPLQGTLAANGKLITLIGSYALPNTNDSWRIRTQVDELEPLSFLERFSFFGRNSRGGNASGGTLVTNSHWMTNEVGPPAASGK